MKLNVPFFKQTTHLNCGPVALRMVIAYLDKDPGLELLEKKTAITEGKGTSTIQLASVVASLGFKTKFFSKHIAFNKENLGLEFYKDFSDMDAEKYKKWMEDARSSGVQMEEKTLTLQELLSFISEDCIPIVLIDWGIITDNKDKGYQGHFVPIVGYDAENVIIHSHGFDKPKEFFEIKRELLDEARKSEGTDEDIVIINKKIK